MDKKNLSAARKKLEEYKLSKTGGAGSGRRGSVGETPPGTRVTEINEKTEPPPSSQEAVVPTFSAPVSYFVPPPPSESIPTFLNNLGQELQSIHSGGDQDVKVLNVTPPSLNDSNLLELNNSSTFVSSPFSAFSTPPSKQEQQQDHHVITPTAPMLFDQENPQPVYDQKAHEHYSDAGQSFPVNFFQSTPISQDYQHHQIQPSNSPYEPQDFYYNLPPQQPSPPLFFNVNGDSITPHMPFFSPQGIEIAPAPFPNEHIVEKVEDPEHQIATTQREQEDSSDPNISSTINMDNNPNPSEPYHELQRTLHAEKVVVENGDDNNSSSSRNQLSNPISSPTTKSLQFNLQENIISPAAEEYTLTEPPHQTQRKSPPPALRKSSVSPAVREEKYVQEVQEIQRMKSIQDALELQMEELRRDNERLLVRQSELISQLENSEKTIQELRRERDRSKEDAKKSLEPLNVRINTLYEENQKIVKNSSDVGMELRSKLQEKAKQYEDMEHAFIIVSKSKMDLAAELDQEREKSKELESQILSKDSEIVELRSTITKLDEKLKVEQQKDIIIHTLEDQIRHYQVQSETLQRELRRSNNKIERLLITSGASHGSLENEQSLQQEEHQHNHVHSENCRHEHSHEGEAQVHDHDHSHDHNSDGHSHDHDSHGHDHEHDHRHHHDHDNVQNGPASLEEGRTRRPSFNPEEEMKRRLHHLEWENSTFRSDLDKLAIEAKERRTFEEKFNKMSEECQKYQSECQRLEHLVVQLQGENDTIGDYITLYQSQRLALKESTREKDLQLTNLAKEREVLLKKMDEVSQLLKVLTQQKSTGDETIGDQIHQCTHQNNGEGGEIEGKIRNLLSEISSSTLIENFHPCAECSGQLLNV